MKGIKKSVALCLAMALTVTAFTGCGAAKTESGADTGATTDFGVETDAKYHAATTVAGATD